MFGGSRHTQWNNWYKRTIREQSLGRRDVCCRRMGEVIFYWVVRTEFLQFRLLMLKIGLVVRVWWITMTRTIIIHWAGTFTKKGYIDLVDVFVRNIGREWDLHLQWKKWTCWPGTKYQGRPTRTRPYEANSADPTISNPKQYLEASCLVFYIIRQYAIV